MVYCDSKIGNVNMDFIWVGLDNRLLELDKEMENFYVFYNGSLVIESFCFEDVGVYFCIVMNK